MYHATATWSGGSVTVRRADDQEAIEAAVDAAFAAGACAVDVQVEWVEGDNGR